MEIPLSLASTIFEPKGLYYFESAYLTSTEAHYFILIEFEGKLVHLVVTASDFDKCKRRLELRNQDPSTLVQVKRSTENQLKKDSFIDCNHVFSGNTLEALEEKLISGTLQFKGVISDGEYLQILNGIITSNDVPRNIVALIKTTLEKINS